MISTEGPTGQATSPAVPDVCRALLTILTRPDLRDQLGDDAQYAAALSRLHLPDDRASRTALLQLVQRVDSLTGRGGAGGAGAVAAADSEGSAGVHGARSVEESADDLKNTLLESYVYIRWSFWVSLIMSLVVFGVGLVLIGLAVARSAGEQTISGGTLTIAGLGMADFLLLFYSKPWRDVANNLSKSQRVKMVATSYLAGVAMTWRSGPDALRQLHDLTRESVHLLGPEEPEPRRLLPNAEPRARKARGGEKRP